MIKGLLAVIVVVPLAAWFLAPPAARPLSPMPPGVTAVPVRGAIHIHTRRSDGDGTGTVDEVAAAAAAAGLKFIILTDHGDATREVDAPQYRGGVLAIDAVEISTDGGHVVALGLARSPYPLAGEPRDVLDDVAPFPAERIRRLRKAERDEMALFGADFDRVDAQHTGSIRGRIRRA